MAIRLNFNKLRANDYALSHDWELVIPTGTLYRLRQHPNWRNNFRSLPTTEDLNLRCKSATLPKTSVKTDRIKIYGMPTTVVLDATSEGTISLVFLEAENFLLYKFFSAWRDLGASDRTHASTAREESTACSVALRLSPTVDHLRGVRGQERLIFFLTGVLPIAVDLSGLNESAEIMRLTVTLKYDNAGVR